MNIIIAVIGSSAFGAVITFLFTWITNRKSNSLNYITDERRKWRDKIREIIIGIESVKYAGKGNKSINKYLIQLEVNINPYGKYDRKDYIRDGHIWDKINKLSESKTEIEFENNKNTLLEYLVLMLKKDWERSKNEVRGYSYIIANMGVMSVCIVYSFIYYFYIFKLDAVPPTIIFIILNGIYFYYLKYYLVDEIDNNSNNNKRMPIKLIIKKERKKRSIVIRGTLILTLFVLFVNIYIGEYYIPNAIKNNMAYCFENGNIYLYSNLDSNLVSGLEENLQALISDKVVLVSGKYDLPGIPQRDYRYDEFIIKAIKNSILVWNIILIVLAVAMPMICMTFSRKQKDEVGRYTIEIDKINTLIKFKQENIIKQLNNFMSRIDFTNKDYTKTNPIYLGIVYSLLNDIKVYLNNEIIKNDMLYGTIEEFDAMVLCKENLAQIKLIMKQIRQINKTLFNKKKNKIYNNVKQSIADLQLTIVK
ncbi:MAG: hypothetical protein E7250_23475 [Paenibacillaceae bacterium]|nr:hypothetical protein [Paenibacillaceae bacterium]